MGLDLGHEKIVRMYEWLKGNWSPPLKVVAFPTHYCNLNCLFCGVSRARDKGEVNYEEELSAEEWRQIVQDCVEYGVWQWDVTGGGEPTSRSERTVGIIRTIKEVKPESIVDLTSNGTWFDRPMIEEIVSLGVDKIQFSIDGPNAEIHNFIRNTPETFEKAWSSVALFNKVKKEMGVDKPLLSINSVLNGRNYDAFREFVEIDAKEGVELHGITPMRVTSETRKKIEDSGLVMTEEMKTEFYDNFDEVREYAAGLGVNLELYLLKGQEDIFEDFDASKYTTENIPDHVEGVTNPIYYAHCLEPWYSFSIDPFGNAGSCLTAAGFSRNDFNLTVASIKDIWHGAYFKSVRQQILDRIPLEVCSHCTIGDERMKFRRIVMDFSKEEARKEGLDLGVG